MIPLPIEFMILGDLTPRLIKSINSTVALSYLANKVFNSVLDRPVSTRSDRMTMGHRARVSTQFQNLFYFISITFPFPYGVDTWPLC